MVYVVDMCRGEAQGFQVVGIGIVSNSSMVFASRVAFFFFFRNSLVKKLGKEKSWNRWSREFRRLE